MLSPQVATLSKIGVTGWLEVATPNRRIEIYRIRPGHRSALWVDSDPGGVRRVLTVGEDCPWIRSNQELEFSDKPVAKGEPQYTRAQAMTWAIWLSASMWLRCRSLVTSQAPVYHEDGGRPPRAARTASRRVCLRLQVADEAA